MILNTVNVISFQNELPNELASYTDDKEGNVEAEKKFKEFVNEIAEDHDHPVDEADMEYFLDEGIMEDQDRKVIIFHSTIGEKENKS